MSIKIKMFMRQLKKEKRKYISWIFIFWFFVWILLYWYNRYQIWDLDNKISNLNQSIDNKEDEYANITSGYDYQRIETAMYFYDNRSDVSWINNITSLIWVFDTVSSIGDWQEIVLEDFSVDMNNVSLRGSISELDLVYSDWWLIDEFVELDFIEEVNIPSYSKRNDYYNFDLSSKIKINE